MDNKNKKTTQKKSSNNKQNKNKTNKLKENKKTTQQKNGSNKINNQTTKSGNKKIENKNKKVLKENLEVIKTEEIKPKRTFNIMFFYAFLVIYLEIITKVLITKSTGGVIYTLLNSIPLIILLYLLSNIFLEKGNKVIAYFITTIFSLYYGFHYFFHRLFSSIFSFNTIGLAGNVIDFKEVLFDTLLSYVGIILLYLIPLILLIILRKRFKFTRNSFKYIIINIFIMVSMFLVSYLSLFINKSDMYSAYNLYYNINNEFKMVEKFGLATYTRIDIKRVIFGFDEKITISPIDENKPEEDPITYNRLEIDFDSLINNESNSTIKDVLTYFKESEASKKNEYTGMFKDKNLIFILAEGFNMIAVDPELTPTLYKLTHEGFVFNNFYSPVFLSTTGGEFQATTGLIPTQEVLYNWKSDTPNIKYAIGNAFSNIGYTANSYHNWTYNYYNRDKTMPTQGFDSYMACGNGLEKMIDCAWLPSDTEMFNKTLPLYQDEERFVSFYITVSGHSPYNFYGNITSKYHTLVNNLPYSESVKAYLASQIEFDRALESLINNLEEAGILDDTVISFVGDHYPYTLSINEINEVSSYKRDEIIEVNRSNFVIWNSKMEEIVNVDKIGSQIDVLPTLLNLFGIEYDSRLIMGRDILSDTPGLAIFSNRSWVSDYGTYNTGKFTLKPGVTIENTQEYIDNINKIVANRFILSNQIIKYNMYDYILK